MSTHLRKTLKAMTNMLMYAGSNVCMKDVPNYIQNVLVYVQMNNYIVRPFRDVILVTNVVTRRTIKA